MDNSRITLRALRAVQAAADTGSFTRAAELMYMTQPAFSRMISGLEEELGVQLFSRTTRKVELTSEGQICYQHITEMLDSFDTMREKLSKAGNISASSLRVGFAGPPGVFLRTMKDFGTQYPNIRLDINSVYSPKLVELLKESSLDCAQLSEEYITPEDGLVTIPVEPLRIYALLNRSHPLYNRALIRVSDLDGVPLVFVESGAPMTHDHMQKTLRERELTFVEAPPANSFDNLIHRVRLGGVVGITAFRDPGTQYTDVTSIPIDLKLSANWVLAWSRDNDNPAIPLFCHLLERKLRQ